MSMPNPIPVSIALTACSLSSFSSSGDDCFPETSSLTDPGWMLHQSYFQDPADLSYGDVNGSVKELERLQATIFSGLEDDSEEVRLNEFPKNTTHIDLEPLLAAAKRMETTFLESSPTRTTNDNCANAAQALTLGTPTSPLVVLSQVQPMAAIMEDPHCPSPASYSFLVPVNRASFQDQESPRKRGRPSLLRMDALPHRRGACSSPSSPCNRGTGSNNGIPIAHSSRPGDHLEGSTFWSTGHDDAPLHPTSAPLSMLALTPVAPPMFTLEAPLKPLPYDYLPYLSRSDSAALSSLSPAPTLPFPVWASLASSPLPDSTQIPPLYMTSVESASYPCFSVSQGVVAHVPSSSPVCSSVGARPKKSPRSSTSSSTSPTEFFIMDPYEHSDKKVDRRSFNSRKELKQAQAQAQAQQAHSQSGSPAVWKSTNE